MNDSMILEIETLEQGLLHWVGIARFATKDSAKDVVEYGKKVIAGFHGSNMAPRLRIINARTNENVGSWGNE